MEIGSLFFSTFIVFLLYYCDNKQKNHLFCPYFWKKIFYAMLLFFCTVIYFIIILPLRTQLNILSLVYWLTVRQRVDIDSKLIPLFIQFLRFRSLQFKFHYNLNDYNCHFSLFLLKS